MRTLYLKKIILNYILEHHITENSKKITFLTIFFYKYNEPYDKLMSVMEKIKAIQGTVFILINAHIPKNAQPPDLETKSAIIKYSYHQVAMKIYYV